MDEDANSTVNATTIIAVLLAAISCPTIKYSDQ
jgi:hypothetical protein